MRELSDRGFDFVVTNRYFAIVSADNRFSALAVIDESLADNAQLNLHLRWRRLMRIELGNGFGLRSRMSPFRAELVIAVAQPTTWGCR